MDHPIQNVVSELLESYAKCGGIKHVDGSSLPSKAGVGALTQDLLHIIFPGFISEHQTTIEDGVFIGSNTALIAPVKVGKDATIGAGSVISKEAPAGELTVARTRQATVPGWQRPRKK